MQKIRVRSILICPANLATYEGKLVLGTHSAQTRYEVIWDFTPIFSFSTLRIFYVNMATSEEGEEGLHILNYDRAFGLI